MGWLAPRPRLWRASMLGKGSTGHKPACQLAQLYKLHFCRSYVKDFGLGGSPISGD